MFKKLHIKIATNSKQIIEVATIFLALIPKIQQVSKIFIIQNLENLKAVKKILKKHYTETKLVGILPSVSNKDFDNKNMDPVRQTKDETNPFYAIVCPSRDGQKTLIKSQELQVIKSIRQNKNKNYSRKRKT